MPLDIWLAFAFASAVLLAIPGPTVMLVVSYAIGRGRLSGWRTVPGVTLGDCTAMTVSLLGAGAVLPHPRRCSRRSSSPARSIWSGSASASGGPSRLCPRRTRRARRIEAAPCSGTPTRTALNPENIVFFIAFVPQFIGAYRALLPRS